MEFNSGFKGLMLVCY